MTSILTGASLYFFIGAIQFKNIMTSNAPELFKTDEIVKIIEIIDGDKVLISNSEGARTVLRILGIKSFDPTVRDPMLLEYGKICFNYFKGMTLNQEARLEITDKAIDDEGRLLGSVYLKDDKDQYLIDVAGDLIGKGYTLVYTRYDFKKANEYLTIQKNAKKEKTGFWSNSKIASRAESMIKMWSQERVND